jgi:alanyl-tRNA synthetase
MSLADEQHEWGAKRVRQTFLDYFNEKNGHTFGMSLSNPLHRLQALQEHVH